MAPPKVILFADDDAWLIQSLIDELAETGFRIIQTGNGSQTIEVFNNQKVDLIILDIMMPPGENLQDTSDGRRTGIQVAKYIRLTRKSVIPIIYFSVVSDFSVLKTIAQIENSVGSTPKVLMKPITGEDLINAVKNCLGNP